MPVLQGSARPDRSRGVCSSPPSYRPTSRYSSRGPPTRRGAGAGNASARSRSFSSRRDLLTAMRVRGVEVAPSRASSRTLFPRDEEVGAAAAARSPPCRARRAARLRAAGETSGARGGSSRLPSLVFTAGLVFVALSSPPRGRAPSNAISLTSAPSDVRTTRGRSPWRSAQRVLLIARGSGVPSSDASDANAQAAALGELHGTIPGLSVL